MPPSDQPKIKSAATSVSAPATPAPAAPSNPPPPAASAPAPQTDGKKKPIFVIEDDSFLVKAYQVKFQKENMPVWIATDGNQALTYLDKEPPGLVMLDLMLPGASGFDVLEAIRKNAKWKDVPVIILSNLSQPQDIDRGKALGAVDYIVKSNMKLGDIIERVKKFY